MEVLNVGRGSAVLVHLNEDSSKVGVVDCYEGDDRSHPLLRRLREIAGDGPAPVIEFLVVTHPHDDHFRGIGAVLAEFEVRRYCDCGIDPRDIARSEHHSPQPYDKVVVTDLEAVEEFIKKYPERHQVLASHSTVIFEQEPYVLATVAPTGKAVASTRREIKKFIGRIVDAAERDDYAAMTRVLRTVSFDLNKVSSALSFAAFDAKMILGGDVLAPEWDRVASILALEAHGFLLSHHGSANALSEPLWEGELLDCVRFAMVSCRGKKHPHNDVIKFLTDKGVDTWCTRIGHRVLSSDPVVELVLVTRGCRSAEASEMCGDVVVSRAPSEELKVDGTRISIRGGLVSAAAETRSYSID